MSIKLSPGERCPAAARSSLESIALRFSSRCRSNGSSTREAYRVPKRPSIRRLTPLRHLPDFSVRGRAVEFSLIHGQAPLASSSALAARIRAAAASAVRKTRRVAGQATRPFPLVTGLVADLTRSLTELLADSTPAQNGLDFPADRAFAECGPRALRPFMTKVDPQRQVSSFVVVLSASITPFTWGLPARASHLCCFGERRRGQRPRQFLRSSPLGCRAAPDNGSVSLCFQSASEDPCFDLVLQPSRF